MSGETLAALVAYTIVMSITPGPNNLMVLASGVNFGFVRSIPHMLGITVGFVVMLLAVGAGLGALMTAVPALYLVLKVLGGAYLLYLAWRIAMSRSVGKGGEVAARPMTFLEAAAFQWVNPKAWVMGVSAMAIYAIPERPVFSVLIIAFVFGAACLPSIAVWAGFGMALRGFLADPIRLKWFNITMGVLLVLTLWPLIR